MNDIIQHWDTQKLGKPYYFFYIYVPKKLSDNEAFSQESIDIQHGIWLLKMVLINNILQISSSKR